MKEKKYVSLSKLRIFQSLTLDEIYQLLNKVTHRYKKYGKGKIVASRGDRCEDLMILIQGEIRGEMMDASGKSIEIETLRAPRAIAPAFIFGRNNIFPVDIITDSEINILKIPRNSLLKLFQYNRIILINFLGMISDKAFFLSDRLYFLTFKTISEKFTQYILNLHSRSQSDRLTLPKSISELSEYFAVSRPSLSRVISKMVNDGIIEQNHRNIFIKDFSRLKLIDRE